MMKTPREGFQKTAFTHELVKVSGSMANSADRVIIPATCKCRYCVAARAAATDPKPGTPADGRRP